MEYHATVQSKPKVPSLPSPFRPFENNMRKGEGSEGSFGSDCKCYDGLEDRKKTIIWALSG